MIVSVLSYDVGEYMYLAEGFFKYSSITTNPEL